MKKLMIGMMLALTLTLSGCADAKDVAEFDKDVEYVIVDNNGNLVVSPVTEDEVKAKIVNIISVDDYKKIKNNDKIEDAVTAALTKK